MKIVLTGDKGGVGKTTIAILTAEWLLAQGYTVKLIDSDPNRSLQTWVDKCEETGYTVSTPKADITIVDTAGTSGAGASHIADAELIIAPFKPHTGDLEVVIGWFVNLRETRQERVVFVPNEWANTKEQRACMREIEATIEEEGRGRLVSGLFYRPAAYGGLLDGRKGNVFLTTFEGFDQKARLEVEALFGAIMGNALPMAAE
jgi:CobQ/CobB/MinD/ParA nucleotide binding domain